MSNQGKVEVDAGARASLVRTVGIAVTVGYVGWWLVWGVLHWLFGGYDDQSTNFVLMVGSGAGALATTFHLWSRVPHFPRDSNIRTLFSLMGFTFLPICVLFSINVVDVVLGWFGRATISQAVNQLAPSLVWYMYGNPKWKTTIPMDSILMFGLVLLGITFYILPMERYVKQQLPWHTISMLALIAFMPVLVAMREAPMAMSVAITLAVAWVGYNFLFLFYLYIKVAVQGAGTMRVAAVLIAFGLVFFIMTWVSGWATGVLFPGLPRWASSVFQILFAAGALLLFNAGFWMIRPGK
ncbi:MAG: hypothetical protein ACTSU5_10120 [Promethearchaeota archaeon]